MEEKDTTGAEKDTVNESNDPLPYARDEDASEERPPLYISGFGVMGQSTPDVATGSTPVTRRDE